MGQLDFKKYVWKRISKDIWKDQERKIWIELKKLDLKENLKEFESLDVKGKAPCVESQIEANTCVVVESQNTLMLFYMKYFQTR